jgi:UDP-N-acetylmuramoylalanine--D-glutamate ligase
MELAGKHILILGLGESGLACARWCDRRGAKVRVLDTRSAPPALAELHRRTTSAEFTSGPMDESFDKALLRGIDALVLSPGLSGGLMAVIHARAAGIPVIGEIELFAHAIRDRALYPITPPVIAITGTNGKTTTTALTGHLLRASGKRVGVAGNISPAALTALMDAQDAGALPDVWVLELSSFQLETTETLNPAAASVLNISDDHLDRYIDIAEYASVKARIFDAPKDTVAIDAGVQVLNRNDRRVRRMARPDRSIISFGLDAPVSQDDFGLSENRGESWIVQGDRYLLPVSELPIAGFHNAANAMAALALCHALGLSATSLLPALRAFRGLAHRVEHVRTLDGVDWYDDSKGTNVGATVAALQGLGRKVVVILGGDGKGQDFTPLAPAIKAHARAAILIGRDGPLIEKEIQRANVPTHIADTLPEAVTLARTLALRGDAVLLSPACASFDMFRNYEHRAHVFVEAVQALPASVGASGCDT